MLRATAVLSLVACAGSSTPAPVAEPIVTRDEHAVFDFNDNRYLAHVVRDGGLVLTPASPGFAKYVPLSGTPGGASPWSVGTLGGRRVGLLRGPATLRVPLDAEETRALVLRVHSEINRELHLSINGHVLHPRPIATSWQLLRIDPEGALRAGENEVTLVADGDGPLGVDWIQLGGHATRDDAPALTTDTGALDLPAGETLVYHVAIPAGAHLVADPGLTTCRVTVTATAADGAEVKGLLGNRVDLTPLAGKIARVSLGLVDPVRGCADVVLPHPVMTVPGTLAAGHRGPAPRHVILWIMDALRADRVRAFDAHARPESPAWDALAARGTRFTRAYVQGNESRASHASIWTALYPVNHQMLREGSKLDPRWVTLGQAAHDAGLATIGQTANGYINPRWGFATAWDALHNAIHEDGSTRGEDVLAGALANLEPFRARSFLLYLGTVDNHVSWRGKEPWLSRYDPGPYRGKYATIATGFDVDRMGPNGLQATPREKQRMIALYDSNVSYQDALLAKLVTRLESWGFGADTMLIITADHGDELWEDGRVGHGGSLRETLIHVPLLVVYPPIFPAGAVVDQPVEAVDLLPTILDALGRPALPDAQGTSLVPLAQAAAGGYPRPAFSSMYEEAYAWRVGDWKLVTRPGAAPALYDLAADPGETKDLAAARPVEWRFMADSFALFLAHQASWKKARWGVATDVTAAFGEDLAR